MAARRVKHPVFGVATVSVPDFKEAVLQGLGSIERGDFIELDTQEDLRRYFNDVVERGKMRLMATLGAEARHRDVVTKNS